MYSKQAWLSTRTYKEEKERKNGIKDKTHERKKHRIPYERRDEKESSSKRDVLQRNDSEGTRRR
jgi:hypothetical protein